MGWGCASRIDTRAEPPRAHRPSCTDRPGLSSRACDERPIGSRPEPGFRFGAAHPGRVRCVSSGSGEVWAELKAPTATVLAFLAVGLCNVIGWLLGGWGASSGTDAASTATPWPVRAEAALFDGSHFLLAALLAWLLIAVACNGNILSGFAEDVYVPSPGQALLHAVQAAVCQALAAHRGSRARADLRLRAPFPIPTRPTTSEAPRVPPSTATSRRWPSSTSSSAGSCGSSRRPGS